MKQEWKFEENKLECGGKCPHKGTKKEILIKENVLEQIRTLTEEVSETEWMAILQGDEKEDKITITGLYIPEQETQKGHIEVTPKGSIEAQEVPNKIGWIHSHNNMGVFFSTNDIETASQNKVSIVVNNKLEAKALTIDTKPCGTNMLEETPVKAERTQKDTNLIKAIKEKIKEKAKEVITWDGYGWQTSRQKQEKADEPKRPAGMSKKEWKRVKKLEREIQRRLKASGEDNRKGMDTDIPEIGWTGTCQHCLTKVSENEEAIFKDGLLYHKECLQFSGGTMEIREYQQYLN